MSAKPQNCDDLKTLIREVPDFPKPGILFYDITTLLKDKLGFARLIDALTEHYIDKHIDLVLGIEARGFIFGPALAYRLNAGFVPVRNRRSFQPRCCAGRTTWSTVATRWKSIKTRSRPGSVSSSATTCWPPEVPPAPRLKW